MLKKLVLIALFTRECLSNDAPSVVTNSGKIVGRYLTSFNGKTYEAYQGIPYALPPIGERRFQPPIPIQPWSGELLANNMGSPCCQYDRFSANSPILGNEDCLYLNVFLPERKTNAALLPVLFWIHGGGFYFGYSQLDEEFYVMDREVVLVTIQYRLGLLGFLSTQDEVVPGNMGLKDQSLALRWVYQNIEHFGGDPKRITLYGQSAGGASVQYHYLSPMSFGLFQNGISFSGTAFDSWAQTKNSRGKAYEVGKLMNCTTSNTKEMLQCLQESSVDDLIIAQNQFMSWFSEPPVPFGPVVEQSSRNSFIERSPREILESGEAYDVPWITGVVSEEGFFPVALWTDKDSLNLIDSNWNDIAPFLLDYNDTIPKDNHTRLAQTAKKHYLGNKPIDKSTFMNLVNMVGNRWFFVGAENAARAQAKANKSPVWFYYYSYRAVDSHISELTNSTDYSGVCHADEISLVMKSSAVIPTKSARDMAMQKVLIDLLMSFATNGNKPDINSKWTKVDSEDRLNYLSISGPEVKNITMTTSDNFGQKKFWNSIDFAENIPVKN